MLKRPQVAAQVPTQSAAGSNGLTDCRDLRGAIHLAGRLDSTERRERGHALRAPPLQSHGPHDHHAGGRAPRLVRQPTPEWR
ncbi:hypothetical protein [Streptomyces syringium]|uniref:hypothetical protein n=1 Tax=Streptomyces syringium TaxID=76729 RepID=UPI0037D1313F